MFSNFVFTGQVKLRLSSHNDVLKVHIESASHLKSDWSSLCSSFAKVQICPSQSSGTSYVTDIVSGTNSPYFNKDIIM